MRGARLAVQQSRPPTGSRSYARHPQSLLSEAVEEFIAAGTAPAEQQIRNVVRARCGQAAATCIAAVLVGVLLGLGRRAGSPPCPTCLRLVCSTPLDILALLQPRPCLVSRVACRLACMFASPTAFSLHYLPHQVACELAYINTSHPQFIGGNRAIAQVGRQGSSLQPLF